MSRIILETIIKAPAPICCNLSRSVELHLASTAHTQETVVAGRNTGLVEAGDTITWRARHFGFFQKLTVTITTVDCPRYFQDRMVRGAFKSFTHDHYFEEAAGQTVMRDVFSYEAPLGLLGRVAEKLVLDSYMRRLLLQRNALIRELAESGRWTEFLPAGS